MNEDNKFFESKVAEAKNQCIDKLIKTCKKAKESEPSREFVIYDLSDLSELKNIKNAIYIFEEIGGNIQDTFDNFTNFKLNGGRACPKLNSPSQVLYVGSSTTGISNRIKQHIGDGTSAKTYALQLRHWFMDKGKCIITIKVYNEESREVIQIIEDALSDILKPAFGKKGGNSK